MFENPPPFPLPNPEAVLWRYMDFSKFVDLLDRSALYFPRAELMEDPYEATLPSLTKQAYANYFGGPGVISSHDALEVTLKNMQIMRTQSCISCWHEGAQESAAMWNLYSKGDDCVAIRTTFERVSRAFSDAPELLFASKVNYLDYSNESFANGVPSFSALEAIIHKRKSFEHEKEVRLILWTHTSKNQSLTYGRLLDRAGDADLPFPHDGYSVQVRLSDLLDSVYVSPKSPRWFRGLVERVLTRYGVDVTPIKSELYDPPLR